MVAIQVLAPLMMALSIIYILGLLIIIVYSLWERNTDSLIISLLLLALPIVSFIFMILFYCYYI